MTKLQFEYSHQQYDLDLVSTGKSYRATMRDEIVDLEILGAQDGQLELFIDGGRVTAYVSSDNTKRWVTVNGQTLVLTKSSGARKGGHAHHHAGDLTAPMPGQVRAVNVSEGDVVTKGQTLLVLEAMKMEIRVQAPRDGEVKKLFVKQGQTVEREQILVTMENG